GSVPWGRLSSLPLACSAGQYVSAIGSALTCSIPSGTVYTAGTGISIDVNNKISSTVMGNTGTVTSITAGTGLTGGTITANGTFALDLARANTWTGAQAFSARASLQKGADFPGGGSWDASGNVGVGTVPSATEKLYVKGDVRIDGTTQTTSGLFEKFLKINVGGTNYVVPLYADSGTQTPPTPTLPYIIMYSTFPNTHNGNFASNGEVTGRNGADKFCINSKPADLACENIHAFLSVDANDSIKSMPTNYGYKADVPIYWWNVAKKSAIYQVASSWADMLDGNIANAENTGTGNNYTYNEKDVKTGNTYKVYTFTGSYSSGKAFAAFSCINFTSVYSASISGSPLYSNKVWLDDGLMANDSCYNVHYIRCVCTH
ncbi:MAG: hypothetical protein AAB530_01550, partial [Patescibacteria group bacterium]